MPTALRYLAVLLAFGALATAAERRSWSHIRYIGGSIAIKASPYDWNATLTLSANPDTLVLAIAPASVFGGHQQTLRLKMSQIATVAVGPGVWERVANVPGAQLPSKPRTLFGLLLDRAFLAIFYQGDDGKPAAVLLDTYSTPQISQALSALTGRPVEYVK